MTSEHGRNRVIGFVASLSQDTRDRTPQPGDHWWRCSDAWAAGSAPIYGGEPGYRKELDGDADGVACEPYR